MSNYGTVVPTFWTGQTGKEIRAKGPEAQLVALYLMTCPHRNALGLYYIPVPFIAHETGLPLKGASKGLQNLIDVGFCDYDEASEVVWVYEMARFQIGESLKKGDNRVKWINEKYKSLPKNPFLLPFYEKYGVGYHLSEPRAFEGASKPETETDTETETETDIFSCPEQTEVCTGLDEVEPDLTVIEFPLNNKTRHAVVESEVTEYEQLYPAVDVRQELRNMLGWLKANPKRRKTGAGIRRFINSWLSRAQDRGGTASSPAASVQQRPYAPRSIKEAKELDLIQQQIWLQNFERSERAKANQQGENVVSFDDIELMLPEPEDNGGSENLCLDFG